MRIGQVAPLYESVPPRLYGGTERVVATLTAALEEAGHDVVLFASGDSCTRARLIASCSEALRLQSAAHDPLAAHVLMVEQAHRTAVELELDLLHFHIDYLHFPASRRAPVPQLTTLHGRLDIPGLVPLYREFRDMPLVSISHAQRAPMPPVRWMATVHHGLATDAYRPGSGSGGYLAFLGRLSPEKRADRAIEIAAASGLPLRIAAKIDPADEHYFEDRIRPLLTRPGVEYIGEIGEEDKQAFLGDAHALLFPIDWPEPFGLVMIEAMACGTPVIAWPCGAVPEVVEHGRTGFVVDSIAAATAAVEAAATLDRGTIRAAFEAGFSAERMAGDYVAVYERLLAREGLRPAAGEVGR